MEKIVVIGGGGHAKVLISILKKNKIYEILGYTDLENKGDLLGVSYIGTDEILQSPQMKAHTCKAAIGMGSVGVSKFRHKVIEKIISYGYDFPAIISTGAIINEDVEIGHGSVVLDGVVINSGARIGSFCIINTNSTIEHDCEIGDFVHIAPGVTLSGGVKVGRKSMIGLGANVKQQVVITSDCLIGAGALVLDDCLVSGKYWGVPAKIR